MLSEKFGADGYVGWGRLAAGGGKEKEVEGGEEVKEAEEGAAHRRECLTRCVGEAKEKEKKEITQRRRVH